MPLECAYCKRRFDWEGYRIEVEHIQGAGCGDFTTVEDFCSKECMERFIETFKPMSKYLCKVRFILIRTPEKSLHPDEQIVLDEKEFDCIRSKCGDKLS